MTPTTTDNQDSDLIESFHTPTEINDEEDADAAYTAAPNGYPSKKKVMVGLWDDICSTNCGP